MAKKHEHKRIYRDGFRIQTHVALPFIDRIRILFGAKASIKTEIVTQNLCGRSQTNSTFVIEKVLPDWFGDFIEHVRGNNNERHQIATDQL